MKKSALFLAMSLTLGLAACGGGGGGDSASGSPVVSGPTPTPSPAPTPAPTTDVCSNVEGVQATVPPGYYAQGTKCTLTDACVNYEGSQTELELTQKHFVRDAATGVCKVEKNHNALAGSGLDVTRMQGHIGKDVVIYVADDGFYPAHQEFTGRIDGSARFVYEGNKKTVIEGDWETPEELAANDHGTGVASMALGERVGAAPGARLFASFGATDMDWLIKRGAQIINNSTSSFYWNTVYSNATENGSEYHAIIKASQAVLVSSAGNESEDLSYQRDSRQTQAKSCLDFPDEASHYLMVGDVNSYSNKPGYIKSYQDRFITIAGVESNGYYSATADAPDSYYTGSAGTSNAAPLVSGAIAILLEVNPNLSAMQAAQALLDTADRPASLGYGTTCSSTTPKGTFTSDCGAMKYGRGLMNVPKAIEVAKTM